MIKKLTIPVDHGNRNMKTTHFLFTTGLSSTDRKPAGREDFLQTDGKYYVLSGKRIPYQRDKTQDERFSILTRFAIAKELERTGQVSEEDVVQVSLPIGVPPKHYAELAERYREYFLGDGKVQELVYNGRTYHTCIQDVAVYPQAYAAMMTEGEKIRQIPKAVGIDIGGFTSDFLLMRYPGRKDGILSGNGGTYGGGNGPEFCDRPAQQCPGTEHRHENYLYHIHRRRSHLTPAVPGKFQATEQVSVH